MSVLKFILSDVTSFLPDNQPGTKKHIQAYMIGTSVMKELNLYLLMGNDVHINEHKKIFFFRIAWFMNHYDNQRTNAYITRLPCKFAANFSQTQKGEKLDVTPIKILGEVGKSSDCGIFCVTNPSCLSFNYNSNSKTCELLDQRKGSWVTLTNWKYFTTKYDNPKKVGEKHISSAFRFLLCENMILSYIVIKKRGTLDAKLLL